MLIGIIPGPEEAQCRINSYLKPVVNDRLSLYEGIDIRVSGRHSEQFTSRAVLLPVWVIFLHHGRFHSF